MKFTNPLTRSVKVGRVKYKEDALPQFKKEHPDRFKQLVAKGLIIIDNKTKEK